MDLDEELRDSLTPCYEGRQEVKLLYSSWLSLVDLRELSMWAVLNWFSYKGGLFGMTSMLSLFPPPPIIDREVNSLTPSHSLFFFFFFFCYRIIDRYISPFA